MAIEFQKGSYAEMIINYIALCGEFPWDGIDLMGRSRRIVLRNIRNLKKEGFITVNGKAEMKTLRITKKAFDKLDERVLHHYLSMTENHKFRGGTKSSGNSGAIQTWRRHRMAEILCVLKDSGVRVWDFTKPYIDMNQYNEKLIEPSDKVFYTSRQIKNADESQSKKTSFTRIMGVLFSPGGIYCVYHTNKGLIKWQRQGEIKAQILVEDIVECNYNKKTDSRFRADDAIMFGKGMDVAVDILESTGGKRTYNNFEMLSFDNTYRNIHYITLDGNGERQLQIIMDHDWRNKLLNLLFPPEIIANKYSSIDCDAITDDAYIMSFLDGNIGKLKRFKQSSLIVNDKSFEILCFPWQAESIGNYMPNAIIRSVELNDIMPYFED